MDPRIGARTAFYVNFALFELVERFLELGLNSVGVLLNLKAMVVCADEGQRYECVDLNHRLEEKVAGHNGSECQ